MTQAAASRPRQHGGAASFDRQRGERLGARTELGGVHLFVLLWVPVTRPAKPARKDSVRPHGGYPGWCQRISERRTRPVDTCTCTAEILSKHYFLRGLWSNKIYKIVYLDFSYPAFVGYSIRKGRRVYPWTRGEASSAQAGRLGIRRLSCLLPDIGYLLLYLLDFFLVPPTFVVRDLCFQLGNLLGVLPVAVSGWQCNTVRAIRPQNESTRRI